MRTGRSPALTWPLIVLSGTAPCHVFKFKLIFFSFYISHCSREYATIPIPFSLQKLKLFSTVFCLVCVKTLMHVLVDDSGHGSSLVEDY